MPEVDDDSWRRRREALGGLLREERLAAGLSLRALSERTRVSNAYLSQLERGRHEPSVRVLAEIASALGVPLGELLARADIVAPWGNERGSRLPQVEAAILGDPELDGPQRLALLGVYRGFMLARRPR
ncbi:MAG: helix-turn-helix transcriptional regulator [Thermoleophilaceae bacterium]|nr:helix-turn-helix transcriptional regulator [Thermoleophilaceae bacterium]